MLGRLTTFVAWSPATVGDKGFLFELDEADLAAKMLQMLAHQRDWQRMGENSLNRIQPMILPGFWLRWKKRTARLSPLSGGVRRNGRSIYKQPEM